MPKITRKELKIIFIELKNILKKYHKGSIYSKYNKTDRYELWSRKDIIIAKRSRKEIFFASIIIQSNYVGLYYMPIYVDSSIKKVLSKELLSMLHGKSCFYITGKKSC